MSRLNMRNPLLLCRPTASRSNRQSEDEAINCNVRYMCPSRMRGRTLIRREGRSGRIIANRRDHMLLRRTRRSSSANCVLTINSQIV